jgi:hypothetical protein
MPENERQTVIQVVFPRELSEEEAQQAIGAAIIEASKSPEERNKCQASTRNFNPEYSFPTIYFP